MDSISKPTVSSVGFFIALNFMHKKWAEALNLQPIVFTVNYERNYKYYAGEL